MKAIKTFIAISSCLVASQATATTITGAGATFPYPLYAKWAQDYKTQTQVSMNYQSIGSGGGIKQITAKTVDFGASDMPLSGERLKAENMVQFPTVVGGVVPIYNVPGLPNGVKFDGEVLADIYLGKIKKWNDPAIAKLNPELKLPSQNITVVRRSDGSGTTFLWTNYLSKVSGNWKNSVGEGVAVKWPVGVGGKGNEGVANYVTRIKGGIGYVEYAYAKQNKIHFGAVKNQQGEFILPSEKGFQAAAGNADWKKADHFNLILTNQSGAGSYPITGATFILMQKTQANAAQGLATLKFFDWAYKNGGKTALALDYIPLPDNVSAQIRDMWAREIKTQQNQAIWK